MPDRLYATLVETMLTAVLCGVTAAPLIAYIAIRYDMVSDVPAWLLAVTLSILLAHALSTVIVAALALALILRWLAAVLLTRDIRP